ncbi:hypothetical protein [Streptomyces sp. NPDC001054]
MDSPTPIQRPSSATHVEVTQSSSPPSGARDFANSTTEASCATSGCPAIAGSASSARTALSSRNRVFRPSRNG